MKKIVVKWEVEGQGELEVDPDEVEGMSSEQMIEWIMEGIHLEIHEQGNFGISIKNLDEVLRLLEEGK